MIQPLHATTGTDTTHAVRQGIRILAVDDNPVILAVLCEVFGSHEFQVVISRNPISAINVFVSERPDAVRPEPLVRSPLRGSPPPRRTDL